MLILLTNDDGVFSPAFSELVQVFASFGRVVVVAPDRDRSGTSHAILREPPPRLQEEGPGVFSCSGTPADCVIQALNKLGSNRPDLVIAGINHGANLSEDITYSGTVGAALEATLNGIPAIAVSLAGREAPWHYDSAGRITAMMAKLWEKRPLPVGTFLNINVPNVPFFALKPPLVTRQGRLPNTNRGLSLSPLWNPVSPRELPEAPEDHQAVALGHPSVTPLLADLTQRRALDNLGEWPCFR
ncbi:MAG: 5'/3'-nucleotidase SurE [Magnetococcales bacterium]|nr:5'/3'-nucleotidase SurE [Magnetococcales bacterium]